MKLFEQTKNMDAHYYLTSDGDETTRDDLLREMRNSYPIYMIYLGPGYVPLKLAVQAFTGEQEAWEAAQEWARKADRLDEIGEDVECAECETRPCEDTGGNVAMYATWMHWYHERKDGVSVWKCPECGWMCEEPDSFGEVEGTVQQVPESLLETAWFIENTGIEQKIAIWKATIEFPASCSASAYVTLDELESILSEEQMDDLRSVYEVVTDNPKIKELIG